MCRKNYMQVIKLLVIVFLVFLNIVPNSVVKAEDRTLYDEIYKETNIMPNLDIDQTLNDSIIQELSTGSRWNVKNSKIVDGEHSFSVDSNGILTSYSGPGGAVSIPEGVVGVGSMAFYNKNITSIEIPLTVHSIGESAFEMNKITILFLPNSILNIGKSAFKNNLIAEVVIPDNFSSIPDGLFAGNRLNSIKIPSSVVSIGEASFKNNIIEAVELPQQLKIIGNEAFSNNKINHLVLPVSLQSIGSYAFFKNQLVKLDIPDAVKIIDSSAFSTNMLESVNLPNNLEILGERAFIYNKLKAINIPSTLKIIPKEAFRNNELTLLMIPDGVQEIGQYAFSFNKLGTVNIGKTVKLIDEYAFMNNLIKNITFFGDRPTLGKRWILQQVPTNMTPPNGNTLITSLESKSGWNTHLQGIVNGSGEIYFKHYRDNVPQLTSFDSFLPIGMAVEESLYKHVRGMDQEDGLLIVNIANHNVDFDKLGKYEVTYVVNDKWGQCAEISNFIHIVPVNDIPVLYSTNIVLETGTGTDADLLNGTYAVDLSDGYIDVKIKEHNVNFQEPGNYFVDYVATDSNANSVEVRNSVTIKTKNIPVIESEDRSFVAGLGSLELLMQSVKAMDTEDGSLAVVVENSNIDFNIPGVYFITYNAIDSDDNSVKKTSTVTITPNGKPVIDSKDLVFKARIASEEDLLLGVVATDREDGLLDVTIKDHNVDFDDAGTFYITYSAVDSFGQIVEVTNTVTILSNSNPVIISIDLSYKVGLGSETSILAQQYANDFEDGSIDIFIKNHNIDFRNPGIYQITYYATDSDNNTVEATNTVTILQDEKPIIISKDLSFKQNQASEIDLLVGVTATDSEDGVLVVQIKVHNVNFDKPGNYTVTYIARDSANQFTEVTNRVVITASNTAPTITASNKTIALGTSLTQSVLLEGVSATDSEDGNLTSKVVVKSHTINPSISGTYQIVYEVKDNGGLVAIKTISVQVVSTTANLKEIPGSFHFEGWTMNNNVVDFKGYLILNNTQNRWSDDLRYEIVFTNVQTKAQTTMVLDRWTTTSQHPFTIPKENGYTYEGAWFKGTLDLSGLPQGDYTAQVRASNGTSKTTASVRNLFSKPQSASYTDANGKGYWFRNNYYLKSVPMEIFIRDQGLLAPKSVSAVDNMFNSYTKMGLSNNSLRIRGTSFNVGGDYSGALKRSIVLENQSTYERFYFGNVGYVDNGDYEVSLRVPDGKSKKRAWFDTQIDLSGLPAGTYTLYVASEAGSVRDVAELNDAFMKPLNLTSGRYTVKLNTDKRMRVELIVK